MMDINVDLLQWFINEKMSDQQLAEELHKPSIRKINKRKVQSPFLDNTWGADLANMQLINKLNKGFRFLLCVPDIYSKYTRLFL